MKPLLLSEIKGNTMYIDCLSGLNVFIPEQFWGCSSLTEAKEQFTKAGQKLHIIEGLRYNPITGKNEEIDIYDNMLIPFPGNELTL